LPANEGNGGSLGVPIPSTEDALSEVDGTTIRCNVEEFSGEVGVHSRRCGEEVEADRSCYFEVVIEGGSRVDQDVIAFFNRALVSRTWGEMIPIAA
jgi:hypothetical protein